jgi:hypothetical protein
MKLIDLYSCRFLLSGGFEVLPENSPVYPRNSFADAGIQLANGGIRLADVKTRARMAELVCERVNSISGCENSLADM